MDVKEKKIIITGGAKGIGRSLAERLVCDGGTVAVFDIDEHSLDKLKKKSINIRVIDLYSIRPLDSKALIKNAKECKNSVIVVEDHYANGIGSAVSSVLGKIKHLHVKETPRSGKPEELLKKYGIDSTAIIKTVMR